MYTCKVCGRFYADEDGLDSSYCSQSCKNNDDDGLVSEDWEDDDE